MKPTDDVPVNVNSDAYSASRAWAAEGARVGSVTCLLCGAAIMLDPADDFDPIDIHDRWHAHIAANLTEAPL